MKKQTFTLTLFLFINFLQAQNPLIKKWDKRFGGTSFDFLTSLQQTNDGGYILGGWTESDSGGDRTQPLWAYVDYWVVKTDSIGNKQWDKRFGGNDWDNLQSVQQTSDGGYILGGSSASDSSGDKTQGNWDILYDTLPDYWIVKIDSIGNKQWDKRFGGINADYLYSLKQTADGGYILGGWSYSGANGDKTQPNWDVTESTSDYWIVKVDSSGSMQWNKRYGGTDTEQLYYLDKTFDGGYILAGVSASGIGGDKSQALWGGTGDYDHWIVKVDSLGIKQWDKRFGGNSIEGLSSIQQTIDGGYILGGYSSSGISGDKSQPLWGTPGDRDFWMIKINSLGIKQWDKDFGAINSEDEYGNITQTSDGGYLLAGTSYSQISGDKTENNLGREQTWVVKTDSIGNKEWDKTLHTDLGNLDDEMGLAFETSDGCYVMANSTRADIGGDKTQSNWDTTAIYHSADFWIIKFCDTTSTTGIPNLYKSKLILVYPNPFTNELNIESGSSELSEIILYDITSRKIVQQKFTNSISLSTEQLEKGIYLYEVKNKNGLCKKGKVVKD